MIIVSDTNILSSLSAGDALAPLFRLFAKTRLIVPAAVQQELQTGLANGKQHLEPVLETIRAGKIEVSSLSAEEELLTFNYPGTLNEGERQAIAIAQVRKLALLCNDKQAIQYCRRRKIEVASLADILHLLWQEKSPRRKKCAG